jgi:DNA-binding MarR family transcriptional regulator
LLRQRLSKQATPASPPLGLLIGAARRSIKQAVTRRLRGRGLSHQQFWLLIALFETPGPSLRELAGRRHMDAPTASRIVGRLVRRGLVRMEDDPGDRRRRLIRLTPDGIILARKIHPLARGVREQIEDGFGAGEARAFGVMLRRVISNMQRAGNGGRGPGTPAAPRRMR